MVCTERQYIESAESLHERIKRLDQIITLLEQRMIDNGENLNIEKYKLNDGQVWIETQYQRLRDVEWALHGYERLKEKYINKLNGRGMVLKPWQGLTRRI